MACLHVHGSKGAEGCTSEEAAQGDSNAEAAVETNTETVEETNTETVEE